MNEALFLFWVALAACMAIMGIVWVIGQAIKNAGVVDPAWALSFSVVALISFFSVYGFGPRKFLMTGMVLLWSLRLGLHILVRVARHHPEEDNRYQKLREQWAKGLGWKFFLFFQAQAVLVAVLSVPFILVIANPMPGLSILEIFSCFVFLAAVAGESLADRQLERFKRDPAHKGQVCQDGLWRYSRHPNYFFEWLVWCAFFLAALSSPYGWVTAYCPALMYVFLTRITGVPAAEEASLRSRGDAYRQYQETTSAFFPWFRKS